MRQVELEAAKGVGDIARNIGGVAVAAKNTTQGANDTQKASQELSQMAARLQAASASGHPVLLRTDAEAGHGIGTALSAEIEKDTDIYTFLVDQLGMAALSKQP